MFHVPFKLSLLFSKVKVSFMFVQCADNWKHFCCFIFSSSWKSRTHGAYWCMCCIPTGAGWVKEIWLNMEMVTLFQKWPRPARFCNMWVSSWYCCRFSCASWWFAVCYWRNGILVYQSTHLNFLSLSLEVIFYLLLLKNIYKKKRITTISFA